MSTLEKWTAAAGAELGLGPGPLSTAETKAVLDVTRDAAHAVDRIRVLAAHWPESTEPPTTAQP